MSKLKKIFAIIDPTSDNRRLLKRAERTAKVRDAKILAYCCIYSNIPSRDPAALKQAEIERHELWMDKLIAPLRERGVDIEYKIDWDPDWRDKLGEAANASGCDLILKSSYSKRAPGRIRKSADWRLLRTANAPIFLLKREESLETARLLAAIKSHEPSHKHRKLNQEIIELANEIISPYDHGQLHAVNAYKDWDDFINPADLAKYVGTDRRNAHSVVGSAEDAIKETAHKIDAEAVVIGTVARDGIAGRVFGNTVERVLDQIDCDIITIVKAS